MMRSEQMAQRLQTLRQEFASGRELMTDLEHRTVSLKEKLLRISGAIQVLEELITDHDVDDPGESEERAQVEEALADAVLPGSV